jgi:Tfp pilus assembly protein PilX
MNPKRNDRGSALPLALVMIVVFGLIGVAIAGYATANLRKANVTRDRTERTVAANDGVTYGIEAFRLNPALCANTKPQLVVAPVLNDKATTVTCNTVLGSYGLTNALGVVLTGLTRTATPYSNDFVDSNVSGCKDKDPFFCSVGPRSLSGPVYVAATSANSADVDFPVKDGNLYYASRNCAATSGWAWGTEQLFTPAELYFRECLTVPSDPEVPAAVPEHEFWRYLVPFDQSTVLISGNQSGGLVAPFLPTSAATMPTGARDTTDPDCTVFSPGVYSNARTPTLLQEDTKKNKAFILDVGNPQGVYFKTGAYYFENVVLLLNVTATGGRVAPGDQPKITNPDCAAAQAADQPAAVNGVRPAGVTFILGGSSQILINQGALQLFTRYDAVAPSTNTLRAGPSIVALEASTRGFTASDPGPASVAAEPGSEVRDSAGALLYQGIRNNGTIPSVEIRGLVWAPRSVVNLANTPGNNGYTYLTGGVVISHGHFKTEESTTNFIFGNTSRISARQVLIESRAAAEKGLDVVARAIIDVSTESRPSVAINTWQVTTEN